MESKIKENALKIMEITKGNICPHCLGRKFSQDLEGPGNPLRGQKIREMLSAEEDVLPNNQEGSEQEVLGTEPCFICQDLFLKINHDLIGRIADKIQYLDLEFDGFLVGSKISADILDKDQSLSDELGIEVENIKKEVNRELGKLLEEKLGKEANFDNPHIIIMVNFKKEVPSIHIQINPLFIEGRYRKLIRGIPQTKWPCRKCKGKGCESCDFTGKMYAETVEELISAPALEMSKSPDSKFHGAGREDIDVLMLGTGRPFVLELKEPRRRTLDLEKLTVLINEHAAGKVEVLDLKYSVRSRKADIKTSSPDTYKVYRARVELDQEITPEQLEELQSLKIIKQRTPIRVSHRRADKVRTREVKSLHSKMLGPKTLELVIKTQGGLYIKELISGDEGRSIPNVSQVLSTSALCVELDVLEVGA